MDIRQKVSGGTGSRSGGLGFGRVLKEPASTLDPSHGGQKKERGTKLAGPPELIQGKSFRGYKQKQQRSRNRKKGGERGGRREGAA